MIRYYLSKQDAASQLVEQAPLLGYQGTGGLPSLYINPAKTFQTLEGFGGAFTESAATTWKKLPLAQQQEVLRAYFDPVQGHGYTFCRVHMNSCDFSLGNYAHVETAGDVDLHSFSIDRDRVALLPMIQAAQQVAGRTLQLMASPWSPPAWMKSNGQMNGGGHLLPQYRAAWASCFVEFIRAYAAEGVPVWGVSVQNEPEAVQTWDSCIYTAEEERDFVRDHLGPTLAAAGLGHVRIVIWDHNRDRMVERADRVLSDPQAAQYIWGTGFHWYVEDHFEHVQMLHDAWPDKHLLFTEGCQEGGPHTGEWAVGERYARSIINDLNRWTVGWIDWNLLLDDTGGPNHVGNLCSAPILANPQTGVLDYQSSYHYLGHFSRFIRPGAKRILCAATREALECCGFLNTDGSIAVVVCNRSDTAIAFDLHWCGQNYATELPAHAIATYVQAA